MSPLVFNSHSLPGLYIHIPFCLTKCPYCDFYSTTNTGEIPRFLRSLRSEMACYVADFSSFDTVYFGGGTPSLLSERDLSYLWQAIAANFSVAADGEVTIEINPGDGNLSYYRTLLAVGFNRIIIGVQSFNDEILAFLGRRHSVQEAYRAVEEACQAGFENIGIDLIYGIPGENLRGWKKTLELALTLPVKHLSCYQLTLEKGTPLKKRLDSGEIILPGEKEELDFFRKTSEYLERAGFIHYEVSNFAAGDRFRSRHNQKYWHHVPYLGVGPGAHSFDGRSRWWNHSSLTDYLTALETGHKPVGGSEILKREELMSETIYLGLRTKRGICLNTFFDLFGIDLLAQKGEVISLLVQAGMIKIDQGTLYPTRQGLALADRLALMF